MKTCFIFMPERYLYSASGTTCGVHMCQWLIYAERQGAAKINTPWRLGFKQQRAECQSHNIKKTLFFFSTSKTITDCESSVRHHWLPVVITVTVTTVTVTVTVTVTLFRQTI